MKDRAVKDWIAHPAFLRCAGCHFWLHRLGVEICLGKVKGTGKKGETKYAKIDTFLALGFVLLLIAC